MSTEVDDFLAHYGVKGMRWGVRKKSSSNVKPSKDYRDSRLIRGKRVSEMSNSELKALNSRLELEQKHKKLNPSKAAQGKAWVTGAIATAGLGISIYNLANHPGTQKGIQFIGGIVRGVMANMASSTASAATSVTLKALGR